ncbi:MAG: SAM-dependent methyltransferase [Collinsella sp.]
MRRECDASRAAGLVDRLLAGRPSPLPRRRHAERVDPGQALVEAAREADVPVELFPALCLRHGARVVRHSLRAFLLRRLFGSQARRPRAPLQRLAVVPGALIFYESPHRIVATLEAVAEVFPQREVAVCRELTKLHEEVLRGPAAQLAEELRARGEVKGEIALVIAPPSEDEEAGIVPVGAAAADPDEALREDIRAALEEGEPASAVAKRLSQKYSRRKRDVYAMVLDMQ